jgi:hypothetical protein
MIYFTFVLAFISTSLLLVGLLYLSTSLPLIFLLKSFWLLNRQILTSCWLLNYWVIIVVFTISTILVQDKCGEAMKLWGYKMVESESELQTFRSVRILFYFSCESLYLALF